MEQGLRILVVDDHRMFCDGVRSLLEPRYTSVDFLRATSAADALALLARRSDLDIVLLDLNLPGISGLSLLQQMRERQIWVPVLVISATRSFSDVQAVVAAGAAGFLCKEAAASELLRAIDTIVRGGTYHAQSSRPSDAAADRITPRQREVLHLVSQGYGNKTIAAQLGISEHTVKAHLHDVFRLLGTRNRTACIREAERLGLIPR